MVIQRNMDLENEERISCSDAGRVFASQKWHFRVDNPFDNMILSFAVNWAAIKERIAQSEMPVSEENEMYGFNEQSQAHMNEFAALQSQMHGAQQSYSLQHSKLMTLLSENKA